MTVPECEYGRYKIDRTPPDPIRRAASQWLRDNERVARRALAVFVKAEVSDTSALLQATDWSDWQINNMLTYLSLVKDEDQT